MDVSWLDRVSPCIRPGRAEESVLSCTAQGTVLPNWTEPLRVIYDHELVLFSKGQFRVELNGRRYACPAGTFLIVPPAALHATWETAGQVGHRYWSHFDWVWQGPYGDTPVMTFHPATPRVGACRSAPAFVPRGVLHGPIPVPQRAYDLAERLSALQTHAAEHDRAVSRAMLLELLLELLDTRPRSLAALPGRTDDLAHQVRDLLERNVGDHGTLRIQDLLERELGHSYAHLCRVFRASYGIPPLKYLNAVCVSRAKLLLRDTDLPVHAIAQRLGFRDPLYFSQLFRKTTRLTPSGFRALRNPPFEETK